MRARIFAEENRKWWTLGAVAFGLFMIMLDNTVVNVALPSIQERPRDLAVRARVGRHRLRAHVRRAHAHGRQARRPLRPAPDLHRRARRSSRLSSLACGLATSASFLIGARVVQGVGAALMNPATLSIIIGHLPAAPARNGDRDLGRRLRDGARDRPADRRHPHRARQLELDLLHQRPGRHRRASSLAASSSTSRRDTSEEQRLDLPGLLTSAVGLFALTYALIEANNYGWTSARILAASPSPSSALVAFVLLERHQRLPMLDLSLFRTATFAGANAVMLLVALAMFGVFFFVSLYMQQVLGYSPIQAGAAFLPMTVLIVLVAPLAGRFSDQIGSRWLMGAGLVAARRARCSPSRRSASSSTFWDILPGADARRRRDVARDDPDDRRGDELRSGGQGRRRLGGAEQHAAGRRLARDRPDGRDRRVSR